MESLVYLASTGKVVMDDAMKKKFEAIRQSNFPITVKGSPDLFEVVSGYKNILTNDQKVIRKYRYSLD